jgi:integrase
MPKQKLTHQFIKGLKKPDKPIIYYDTNVTGLRLRHSKAGSKTFKYRYHFGGKHRTFTIGKFPAVSLSDARKRVQALKTKINDGIDPQAQKNERKRKPDKITFKELTGEYKSKYLPTLRPQTAKGYQRHIDSYLQVLNDIPVSEISKNDILSILDKKAYQDGSPTHANRIRSTLSSMFSFAVKRDITDKNIISSVSTYEGDRVRRSRYYEESELRELWDYFDSFITPTGQVFKMLLICGQRKAETMKIRWDDIRGDIWTIPAEIAKNGQPHDVPLSDMAMQIIEEMKEYSGDSAYVFQSPRVDNQPIGSIKVSKEVIQKHSNIDDFRPHDLRRSVATYMAKLGVDRTVLGKILNHKGLAGDSQVTAIYDRYSYTPQKRQALNRWSGKLQQIIEEQETKIHKIG